jgi:NodT family efflux transporter outer membrane factor (OMF) lipoprotein
MRPHRTANSQKRTASITQGTSHITQRTSNIEHSTSNIELKIMVTNAAKRLATFFSSRGKNNADRFQGLEHVSATSMFNVGCSVFDVQKRFMLPACLSLAAAFLLFSGCMVGPDYRAPQYPAPRGWSETAATQPVAITNWWTQFNDATLNSLIARAIATNLDLKIAESRVRQARAARGVITAGFWPAADVSGQYRRQHSGGTYPVSGDMYQAGLDASWEIDIFGGVRRNIEAAEADIAASVENRRAVLISLAAEVALDYLNLRGYQQQIAIANENLAAQERTAALTRKRFPAFVSRLDVANAEALVATTRAAIPVLETAARQTIFALSVLLARAPAALAAELEAAAPLPPTLPEVPVGLPADLLRRRPDVRAAEAAVHGATARIGVATADLFPKFSLTGSLGTSSTTPSGLGNWNNRVYSFGPSATWSLFAAGSIMANIEVQNEAEQQTLLSYQKTVLTALSDVEGALVAYFKEQQHRQALAAAVAANKEAVELSTRLYTEGQTDFLNVLSAQRALYSVQDALVQSERSIATDLLAIYKALGGGWENEPPIPPRPSR